MCECKLLHVNSGCDRGGLLPAPCCCRPMVAPLQRAASRVKCLKPSGASAGAQLSRAGSWEGGWVRRQAAASQKLESCCWRHMRLPLLPWQRLRPPPLPLYPLSPYRKAKPCNTMSANARAACWELNKHVQPAWRPNKRMQVWGCAAGLVARYAGACWQEGWGCCCGWRTRQLAAARMPPLLPRRRYLVAHAACSGLPPMFLRLPALLPLRACPRPADLLALRPRPASSDRTRPRPPAHPSPQVCCPPQRRQWRGWWSGRAAAGRGGASGCTRGGSYGAPHGGGCAAGCSGGSFVTAAMVVWLLAWRCCPAANVTMLRLAAEESNDKLRRRRWPPVEGQHGRWQHKAAGPITVRLPPACHHVVAQ